MFTGCYWWWQGIWAYLNHLANILHNRVPFIILSSPGYGHIFGLSIYVPHYLRQYLLDLDLDLSNTALSVLFS